MHAAPQGDPPISEVLEALSRALDITEGQLPGHCYRTMLIAVRLGREIGLDEADLVRLYYAALLKDAGCSSNSARVHQVFGGDEIVIKRNVKYTDWSRAIDSVKYALRSMAPDDTVGERLRRIIGMMGPPNKIMDQVTQARCTRGAEIAASLGFDRDVSEAVRSLDEHWDGKGSPSHLKGDAIPLLARILCLAQTFEVFASGYGKAAAYVMLNERKGRWFDPELVAGAYSFAEDRIFWETWAKHLRGEDVTSPLSSEVLNVETAGIDQVCDSFAQIVDAKSGFTGEHSARVTTYAVQLGRYFGFDMERLQTLKRAALLHDVGKLGVPNSILDKPGKLTDAEFARVREHPRYTFKILSAISGFERINAIADAHHEKLNGRGYWRGMEADQLDLDMRILAVADIFDALSAERPYRAALPLEKVFAIMRSEAGEQIDASCVEALAEIYGQGVGPAEVPAAA